jgi:hypothetical protein
MKPILATAVVLALTACSPAPSGNETTASVASATPVAMPAASPTPAPAADVLALEGLGALTIGRPVPQGSGWASGGAQVSDACTTVSSPDYPGVYAIVEQGKVRRISLGQRSTVKLIEGIGVGASETAVTAAFPGFRATPHKYEAAPARYLTAPGADRGDPALRFEIGPDGKVSAIHVGTAPALFYVEGCA